MCLRRWQWNFADWSQVCCKWSPGLAGSLGWSDRQSDAEPGSSPMTCLSSQALALDPCTGCRCRSMGVRTIIVRVAIIAMFIWRDYVIQGKFMCPTHSEAKQTEIAGVWGRERCISGPCRKNRWTSVRRKSLGLGVQASPLPAPANPVAPWLG